MSTPSQPSPEWVTLAELIRPRGNKGELLAFDLTTGPERFLGLEQVWLFDAQNQLHSQVPVEDAWLHGDALVLKFQGVDSIGEAERLRGGEVRIPAALRAKLPEGEYYLSDLIGCRVALQSEPEGTIGRVAAVLEGPGGNLIELEDERLIPLARAICPVIDPANRVILIDPPDGLLDQT